MNDLESVVPFYTVVKTLAAGKGIKADIVLKGGSEVRNAALDILDDSEPSIPSEVSSFLRQQLELTGQHGFVLSLEIDSETGNISSHRTRITGDLARKVTRMANAPHKK